MLTLASLFLIQSNPCPVKRGWMPRSPTDACNTTSASCSCGGCSSAKDSRTFLLLKHEGFPLRMQLLNNRLSWKPTSCRLTCLIFLQALPMSLSFENWARVSAVQRITVKACEQKLHFCSPAAGVQSRGYLFIFNQP